MKKSAKKMYANLPNRIDCGLGTYKPPLFPLVKDENGLIESLDGTRYSRKRQHYPVKG